MQLQLQHRLVSALNSKMNRITLLVAGVSIVTSTCSCGNTNAEAAADVTVIEYVGVFTIVYVALTIGMFGLAFFCWVLSSSERTGIRNAAVFFLLIGLLFGTWTVFGRPEAVVITPDGISQRYNPERVDFKDVERVRVSTRKLGTHGGRGDNRRRREQTVWKFELNPETDPHRRRTAELSFFMHTWPQGDDLIMEKLLEHGVTVWDERRNR